MSAQTDHSNPICGALGCHETADVVIRHPKHGKRTVCDNCTGGHVVIRHV
ncbi:hypothetical protein HALLA_11970 [Halostagnicola larsenii XH-48]|uniref:Uncharacterized protein n=1 Tax=Halostagnicola larsenii XH-48 TaxID=797299 RepID=W0JLG0_9EURY|nr:hypothetical protein [Halostagnicola larsenii]AHF99423.1 hypothetical protein HALLA_11680 [Halostagnicola larsenii XH-48]AHF99434.1 hypothetical protein HALLA_11970 [Halostagnicola larsenii XH-48]